MNIIILVAEALVMLFILRALLQSSSADFYHPITQSVLKLTNFAVNLPALKNVRVGSLYLAGIIVAFIISLVFWLTLGSFIFKVPIKIAILLSFLMFIKSFGYLIVALLIVQALCSWLESTRAFSYYLSQITYIFVAPLQRIIPPIGMIDISLMIFLLVIFFLNNLMAKMFGLLWLII